MLCEKYLNQVEKELETAKAWALSRPVLCVHESKIKVFQMKDKPVAACIAWDFTPIQISQGLSSSEWSELERVLSRLIKEGVLD